MDIYVYKDELSSSQLRPAKNDLSDAVSKMNSALSSAASAYGYEGRMIFGGQIGELRSCLSELNELSNRLEQYATMMDAAPSALIEADAKFKSVLSNGWERLRYHITVVKQTDTYQYGKCVVRVVKDIVTVVASVGAIAGGASAPIGIVGIISAGNDIINAFTDAAYVYSDQDEMVGTSNWLKDTLNDGYGELGEMLGNREAGEMFGELTYVGLDGISFLNKSDKMLKAYGKVNTDLYGTTGYSFVWGRTSWDDVFDNKIKGVGIGEIDFGGVVRTVLGVDPDSTNNLIYEAIENTIEVYGKGKSVAGKLIEIIS